MAIKKARKQLKTGKKMASVKSLRYGQRAAH
jgi:hypothetical protein